jgi:prevent-host-death family protein
MEHIPISKFKANCAAVVEKVGKSGKSVVITRHGKPVAWLQPPAAERPKKRRLGFM